MTDFNSIPALLKAILDEQIKMNALLAKSEPAAITQAVEVVQPKVETKKGVVPAYKEEPKKAAPKKPEPSPEPESTERDEDQFQAARTLFLKAAAELGREYVVEMLARYKIANFKDISATDLPKAQAELEAAMSQVAA